MTAKNSEEEQKGTEGSLKENQREEFVGRLGTLPTTSFAELKNLRERSEKRWTNFRSDHGILLENSRYALLVPTTKSLISSLLRRQHLLCGSMRWFVHAVGARRMLEVTMSKRYTRKLFDPSSARSRAAPI